MLCKFAETTCCYCPKPFCEVGAQAAHRICPISRAMFCTSLFSHFFPLLDIWEDVLDAQGTMNEACRLQSAERYFNSQSHFDQ